jgi:hypothetical protein
MKLVMIAYRFEYNERVEQILSANQIQDFILHPSAQGSEQDGKHYGNKVHPGLMAQVWVRVRDDALDGLLDDLRAFKEQKSAHGHLTALVLGVEQDV